MEELVTHQPHGSGCPARQGSRDVGTIPAQLRLYSCSSTHRRHTHRRSRSLARTPARSSCRPLSPQIAPSRVLRSSRESCPLIGNLASVGLRYRDPHSARPFRHSCSRVWTVTAWQHGLAPTSASERAKGGHTEGSPGTQTSSAELCTSTDRTGRPELW